MKDIFQLRKCNYKSRNCDEFVSYCVKTVNYGTETISFLGLKLWTILPHEYKDSNTLTDLRAKLKTGYPKIVLAGFARLIFTNWVLFELRLIEFSSENN